MGATALPEARRCRAVLRAHARQPSDRRAAFASRHPRHPSKRPQRAAGCSAAGGSGASRPLPPKNFEKEALRAALLEYSCHVDSTVVDTFQREGPTEVLEAIQASVCATLGSLPPELFEVFVVSRPEHFRAYLHSFLMSGYSCRQIMDHLQLTDRLEGATPTSALQDEHAPGHEAMAGRTGKAGYVKGAKQVGVQGEVQRWSLQSGLERVPAGQYMRLLESEVDMLRAEVERHRQKAEEETNELLEFMRKSPRKAFDASEDATAAMTAFCDRIMGLSEDAHPQARRKMTVSELQRCFMWATIVGYTLRSIEVTYSIRRDYTLPPVVLQNKGFLDL